MPILARWIINAFLFLAVANLLPGQIHVDGFVTALWVAFLWGLVSITIKPLLLLLTLPVNLLTFGLFTFVINAILFLFLSKLVSGFFVASFWSAFMGALVLSALHALVHWVFRNQMLQGE